MGKHKAIRRFLGIFLAVVMVFTLWTPIPVAASTKKSHATTEIQVGESTKLRAYGFSWRTTWKSSDENIVTVKNDGTITGINPGEATVTASLRTFGSIFTGRERTEKFNIVVVENDTPESETIEVNVGETVSLDKPSNVRTTWRSSDTSVATVSSSGTVTGISAGNVTITATTRTGGFHFWFIHWGGKTTTTEYYITVVDNGETPEPTPTVTPEPTTTPDPTATPEPVKQYTVTFESDGGSEVESQVVDEGQTAVKPNDPVKEGFSFEGWYLDEEFTTEYDFTTAITENIVLYAKWVAIDEGITDSDKDKLVDLDEKVLGTDPFNPDTDNDGLTDYEEVVLGTDPLSPNDYDDSLDSDADGLTDTEEATIYITDPYSADTDNDSLNDYEEVNVYGTDPTKVDTDDDTLSDSFEIEHGLDPNNASTDGITNDGEIAIEQTITDDGISLPLRDESNLAKPSISGAVSGELADNVFLSTNTDSALSDMRSVIGEAVYIEGSDDYINGLNLTFDLSSYEGSLENLVIVILNDDGLFEITDSTLAGTILSCQLQKSGTYCVLDLNDFLDSIGFDLSSYWDGNMESNASTYSPLPEVDQGEDANAIVYDENDLNEDAESVEENSYDNETSSISSYSSSTEPDSYSAEVDESLLATLNETNRALLSSTVSGQADIVFAIDTTGSMSSTINNVVTNVTSFATTLSDNYNVNVNYALIDYKDLEEDGEGTTLVVKNGSSNWFSNVDTFAEKVSALVAAGGGDSPECSIDALETARRLDFRTSASKFIILITDDSYKIANSYGITSMEEEIELLKADGIITSVVTSSRYQSTYQNLYESTGGIYADISSSNFSSSLLELANMIGEITSDGTWVILKHGYRYVRLTDETDQDGDGLSTTYEIGDEVEIDLSPLIKLQLALHGVPYENYIGESAITVYDAKSDPTKDDTDDDGILDKKDTAPWTEGLKDGITGGVKICSYGDGASSSAGISGHAYIAYTSFITKEVTFYGIKVNSPEECAKKNGDDRSDRPEDHTFSVNSNSVTSLGGWAGWLPDALKGAWINNEYMLFIDGSVPEGQTSLMKYITNAQLEKMQNSVKEHSKWTYLYNCAAFAADVWNDTLDDDISPYGPWASPRSLAYQIQKRDGYAIDDPMLAEWPE